MCYDKIRIDRRKEKDNRNLNLSNMSEAADEVGGHRTIIVKHHILKHHIPELPMYTCVF